MGPISELHLLTTCALRIDGYLWMVNQGLEREDLMKAFWHEDARERLFAESWDYQWAAWFMQQRSVAWSQSEPTAEAVALWRRLFVALAAKRPSPPFDRGGPDGEPTAVREWERLYAPQVSELCVAVRARLERGAPLAEPFELG